MVAVATAMVAVATAMVAMVVALTVVAAHKRDRAHRQHCRSERGRIAPDTKWRSPADEEAALGAAAVAKGAEAAEAEATTEAVVGRCRSTQTAGLRSLHPTHKRQRSQHWSYTSVVAPPRQRPYLPRPSTRCQSQGLGSRCRCRRSRRQPDRMVPDAVKEAVGLGGAVATVVAVEAARAKRAAEAVEAAQTARPVGTVAAWCRCMQTAGPRSHHPTYKSRRSRRWSYTRAPVAAPLR